MGGARHSVGERGETEPLTLSPPPASYTRPPPPPLPPQPTAGHTPPHPTPPRPRASPDRLRRSQDRSGPSTDVCKAHRHRHRREPTNHVIRTPPDLARLSGGRRSTLTGRVPTHPSPDHRSMLRNNVDDVEFARGCTAAGAQVRNRFRSGGPFSPSSSFSRDACGRRCRRVVANVECVPCAAPRGHVRLPCRGHAEHHLPDHDCPLPMTAACQIARPSG